MRVLNRFHSSGRCSLGCHWPKLSRWLKMRSLARAFSSSRRAPPMSTSKRCSSMVSSSVTVWWPLRDSSGCARRIVPLAIESSRWPTTRRSPISATRRSRNSMTSGKLWPVSTCTSGKGSLPLNSLPETRCLKAFSASRSTTHESLPPENSRAGRSKAAATSRRMKIASSSRWSRWRWSASGSNCSRFTGAFMPGLRWSR